MDNLLSSGEAYAFTILKKWEDLIEVSEKFRFYFLNASIYKDTKVQDPEEVKILHLYVSMITRFWLELLPHIQRMKGVSPLKERFLTFKTYYKNPKLLVNGEHSEDLFNLEQVLREAIEEMKITQFQ